MVLMIKIIKMKQLKNTNKLICKQICDSFFAFLIKKVKNSQSIITLVTRIIVSYSTSPTQIVLHLHIAISVRPNDTFY